MLKMLIHRVTSRLQRVKFVFDCLTLRMERVGSLETYITIFQKTQNIVLGYLNVKKPYSGPYEVLHKLLEQVGSVVLLVYWREVQILDPFGGFPEMVLVFSCLHSSLKIPTWNPPCCSVAVSTVHPVAVSPSAQSTLLQCRRQHSPPCCSVAVSTVHPAAVSPSAQSTRQSSLHTPTPINL
jgi:hypothetical protein